MENIIEQHGEYGPIQVMETAVAYYHLDDEKVSFGPSKKRFRNFKFSIIAWEWNWTIFYFQSVASMIFMPRGILVNLSFM